VLDLLVHPMINLSIRFRQKLSIAIVRFVAVHTFSELVVPGHEFIKPLKKAHPPTTIIIITTTTTTTTTVAATACSFSSILRLFRRMLNVLSYSSSSILRLFRRMLDVLSSSFFGIFTAVDVNDMFLTNL
jgi:hypothetical protein